jgi:hypothetical protein
MGKKGKRKKGNAKKGNDKTDDDNDRPKMIDQKN